jgi:diacylglycerol O-acyltransferase-1
MSSIIETAISTSTEAPGVNSKASIDKNVPEPDKSNGSIPPSTNSKSVERKYRHVAAYHSKPRASCLSHDSDAAPSFLGFRNLMVLVLSMTPHPPLASCITIETVADM